MLFESSIIRFIHRTGSHVLCLLFYCLIKLRCRYLNYSSELNLFHMVMCLRLRVGVNVLARVPVSVRVHWRWCKRAQALVHLQFIKTRRVARRWATIEWSWRCQRTSPLCRYPLSSSPTTFVSIHFALLNVVTGLMPFIWSSCRLSGHRAKSYFAGGRLVPKSSILSFIYCTYSQ